ncbi:hypothetical protein O3597_16560 [Verrucosispora sp. WMMA2044]|uniref:hypothetical protein n=1 Tax=Verrucosispora sp. WMMA2044 TaxID=3016419 RepID=UPI00248BF259|nr:hypothetical protein [Verrucosispora sp. WMMA2044]WBB46798.1 hypothetical protein O3597_16560 [Verrucosispora sp. WMMA2044]
MGDLLINLLASVIAGTAVWLTGFLLRRHKLNRARAFFGLAAGASCLLVVSRHASSPREFSVHRRDVAALVSWRPSPANAAPGRTGSARTNRPARSAG